MSHGGKKIEGLPSKKWRDRILGSFIGFLLLVSVISTGLATDYYASWKEEIGLRAESQRMMSEWKEAYERVSRKDLMPIITRLQSRLDPVLAREVSDAIQKYSSEYRLPPELIIHIIDRESRFRPLVRSSAGAVGLMQIMTKVHTDKLKEMNITAEEAYHIDNNIKLGCWIFREYFDKAKDIEKALTRYVGGSHEKYVKDILVAFTNEAIIGVKVERKDNETELSGTIERERELETPTVYERERESKEKAVNSQGNGQSG
jgi:hypothetical protein